MPRDFLPRPEAELLGWSSNFLRQILADGAALGLSPVQCAAYQAKHEALAALSRTSHDPATRTAPVNRAKSEARAVLEAQARLLARIIRANPNVTASQRSDLRLSAPLGKGSRIPRPATAPRVEVLGVSGRTVRVQLSDTGAPDNRGKPRGVASAVILSFIGDQPPAGRAGWTLQDTSGRTRVGVTFGSDVEPGTKVWITAAWLNPRGQRGPGATPAPAIIGIAGPALASLALAA
jgi:hypothetical protein